MNTIDRKAGREKYREIEKTDVWCATRHSHRARTVETANARHVDLTHLNQRQRDAAWRFLRKEGVISRLPGGTYISYLDLDELREVVDALYP